MWPVYSKTKNTFAISHSKGSVSYTFHKTNLFMQTTVHLLTLKYVPTQSLIYCMYRLDCRGFYENSSRELDICHFSRYIFMNSLASSIHAQLHMGDLF